MVTAAMKLKRQLLLAIKPMTILDSELKKQRHYFANKVPCSQSYGFSSSHVWMWDLDHKEGWAPKNWCFQTVVLKDTLENSLDHKEIKQVNPTGNLCLIFIGRTNAEAPILWPPDLKNQLGGRTLMLGKTEGKRKRCCRGWDGCMASPSQWTWIWANSRR